MQDFSLNLHIYIIPFLQAFSGHFVCIMDTGECLYMWSGWNTVWETDRLKSRKTWSDSMGWRKREKWKGLERGEVVGRWEEKGGVCFNRLQMVRSKQFSVVNDGSPVTELTSIW